MSKKSASKSNCNELPETLADPKFAELRELLIKSAKETGRMWKKTDLAHYFDGMNEAKRSQFAPFCLEWYKFLKKACPNEDSSKLPTFFPEKASVQDAFLAVKTAIIACCSRKEIEKVLTENGARCLDTEVELIMRSRRPEWLSNFLLWIASLTGIMNVGEYDYWYIYRRFVLEKIIKPVKNDLWIRTMFSAMLFATGNNIDSKPKTLLRQLQDDSGLLEREIWELFAFESFPNGWNLTSSDNHFERKGKDWKGTICELVEKKKIPQKRVLDGCFHSLQQPFSDHESKWYVQILEQMIGELPIKDDELVKDKRFLGLLDNPNPTPRTLGAAILERLFKAGKISDSEIVAYAPMLLREIAKTKLKKTLGMLDKIAKKNTNLRSDIFSAVLESLQHESADIQSASLDLLMKYGAFADQKIVDAVKNIAPSLAASVRKQLPGEKEKPAESKTKAVALQKSAVKSVSIYEPITPIKNFEELLDLASQLVEGFKEIDDVERLVDGLARLGTERPKDFKEKTASLLARTQKLIEKLEVPHPKDKSKLVIFDDWKPFTGQDILVDIRFAIASWICGELPQVEDMPKAVEMPGDSGASLVYLRWKFASLEERRYVKQLRHGNFTWLVNDEHCKRFRPSPSIPSLVIFSKRTENIVKNICDGKVTSLLSTPTHRGGWIDASIFVKRLIEAESKGIKYDDSDKVLALLRLMPEGRSAALKLFEATNPSKNEWNNAVRYSLGAEKIKIGKAPHFWIAAARCRNSIDDNTAIEKAFPGYGPDAGISATYHFEIRKIDYHETFLAIPQPELPKTSMDWSLLLLAALHSSTTIHWAERDGVFPWFLSIWPQNLDPAIAISINSHSQNVDKNYDYGFRHALTAIALSPVSFSPIGATALFLGLGAKFAMLHNTAIDTLITVIADGRLTLELTTATIRELLQFDYVTLSRWLKPFKTIVEQSDSHAVFIQELLENIIDSIPSRETGSFLELIYELAVSLDRPIRSDKCRLFLESLTGTGKAAKLAKKLLEL